MVVFLIIISVVSCVIFHCNAKIKIKGIRKNLKLKNPFPSKCEVYCFLLRGRIEEGDSFECLILVKKILLPECVRFMASNGRD
jgi:hypothetical protein